MLASLDVPLFSSTASTEKILPSLLEIKNAVIGSNKQKSSLIAVGLLPRLIQIVSDQALEINVRTEAVIVLGSVANGTEDDARATVESGIVIALLRVLSEECDYLPILEACLRCLRTLYQRALISGLVLYQDHAVISRLISLLPRTTCTQECITTIFGLSCQSAEQQATLCASGLVSMLPALLTSVYKVQLPALKCLAALARNNKQVSAVIASTTHNGVSVPSLLGEMLRRDNTLEMQMCSAKCLTYLCRAGTVDVRDVLISHKVLPSLVRMCKKDKTWEQRVEGAETLAYLIETDPSLQQTAVIADQLIPTLLEYFKYPGNPLNPVLMPKVKDEISVGNELRSAAFYAFAALASNEEDIRKRVMEAEGLMVYLVAGLSDPVLKVQLAAVRCLHSLSRSVHQLRTNIHDQSISKPLLKMLQAGNEDILPVASAALCNMLLEFSPTKESLVDGGVLDIMVKLVHSRNTTLRLNGIWAFMNVSFQSTLQLKLQIMSVLGMEQIFQLLGDAEVQIVLKTLGLIRNLLSNAEETDHVMLSHGTQIMQVIVLVLEGDHSNSVKEQALCIVANVADGDHSKEFIMSNEDVLRKLLHYLVHHNAKLQIASAACVYNLLSSKDEGAHQRLERLRLLNFPRELKNLLGTSDTVLYEKVKAALHLF